MRTAMTDDVLILARRALQDSQAKTANYETPENAAKQPTKNAAKDHESEAAKFALETIPADELRQEAGQDWEWMHANPKSFEAFALLVMSSRMMRAGQVPSHFIAHAHCKRCGDVPIFEGCAPIVAGCPWCFVGGFRGGSEGVPMP